MMHGLTNLKTHIGVAAIMRHLDFGIKHVKMLGIFYISKFWRGFDDVHCT